MDAYSNYLETRATTMSDWDCLGQADGGVWDSSYVIVYIKSRKWYLDISKVSTV